MSSAQAVALDAAQLIRRGFTQPTGPTRAELCRARTESGEICSHLSPKAAKWSLAGAVLKACGDDGEDHARDPRAVAVFAVMKKQLGEEPSAWANAPLRWQNQVVDALEAAARALEGAE